jgi:hypothetical protein
MRFVGAVVALVLALGIFSVLQPSEPRMGALAAARELKAEYAHDARSVDCHRDSNDGSISINGHMDYTCTVKYRNGETLEWWLATDRHHITDYSSEGP